MTLDNQQLDSPDLDLRVSPQAAHERHCFIVMPFGRDEEEKRWYKGWYDVVIQPAVKEAGYEPKLSALEERPTPINDEIRSHLAYDPMVVVDLGGLTPTADPNPNVMYELGIRHALDLPLVMMAWKGQHLPFDVALQRVVMEGRHLVDLELNRQKLVAFIGAAANGHYYRPMQAVGRVAALEAASVSLGPESVLGALVREVRDLRAVFSTWRDVLPKPKAALSPNPAKKKDRKAFRSRHWASFQAAGGTIPNWDGFVGPLITTPEFMQRASNWGPAEWREFLESALQQQAVRRAVSKSTPQERAALPTTGDSELSQDVEEKNSPRSNIGE